jgi:uroporphyrin-III C-methyltransferase / precorrin-2 dehydrogenase / sirohydrochlorin ferrochelatase
MHSLPVFIRLSGRPVILIGSGDAAAAKRTLLERAGAVIVGEQADAAIAIVAEDDDTLAEAAIARLKARGVLVNATDRAALCDFTLPAIIDRDPVIIAIGTGGASAGLAKALRQRLEAMLPQSLGRLAQTLFGALKAVRERWPDPTNRRHAIDNALFPGGALDLLRDFEESNFDAWLKSDDATAPAGLKTYTITFDDPDQLTLEQARLLGQADVVIHDPAIAPAILARARADAVRIASTTLPEPMPQGLVIRLMKEARP